MGYSSGTKVWQGGERPCRLDQSQIIRDELNDSVWSAAEKSIRDNQGLVIAGAVGSGKTVIMREIDASLSTSARPGLYRERYIWLDTPNWWVSADEFCEDVKRGWEFAKQFSDWSEMYSADGIAAQVQRLFLDDLGIERPTDSNLDAISNLLTARHRACLPTWITTNLDAEQFVARYGERILSRLFERGTFIQLRGGDRRRNGMPRKGP